MKLRASLSTIDLLFYVTIGLSIILALVPLGLYAAILGSAPTISPSTAIKLLNETGEMAVLVDVRQESEYLKRHVTGAMNLPYVRIQKMAGENDLPISLQGKTLLLVCDYGILSAQAARHLVALGVSAFTVRGGMLDWGRAWPQYTGNLFSGFETVGGHVQIPFRAMSPGEQGAAALALIWIKPTYMLLSAIVAFVLLLNEAADLRVLGWGFLIFLFGEVFCAINYIFLKDNSYFAEYLHSYSMAMAFGLMGYAILEGLDKRIFHFSEPDKRCAFLPVCGPCAKYQSVRCGARRISQVMCIVLIILAFIPLLSPFSQTAYSTRIGPVNHYYVRPAVHQWFEARYSPGLAIVLLCVALVVMKLTPQVAIHPLARILFCGGFGFIGFALFRVTLGMVFADALVWTIFWEELTELLFVCATIYILWVFHRTLLPGFKIPIVNFGKS